MARTRHASGTGSSNDKNAVGKPSPCGPPRAPWCPPHSPPGPQAPVTEYRNSTTVVTECPQPVARSYLDRRRALRRTPSQLSFPGTFVPCVSLSSSSLPVRRSRVFKRPAVPVNKRCRELYLRHIRESVDHPIDFHHFFFLFPFPGLTVPFWNAFSCSFAANGK